MKWFQRNGTCIFDYDLKKNEHNKIGVNKGTDIAGEFEKLCKAEGIQFYFTMNEAMTAFAEQTKRSLKNKLYHYLEEYGYQYIKKMFHFVTTLNSRKNRSIYLIPKNVKNSDFLSVLYSKLLREHKKPGLKLETVFASQSTTNPSGRVINHSLHRSFSEV